MVAMVIVAAFLGGCFSNPAEPTPAPTPTPTPKILPNTLDNPAVVSEIALGGGAGEPNIIADINGTVYITAVDELYRSPDWGKTWKALGASKTTGHGDGDIGVDQWGRLYWLGLGGTGGPIPFQYSDNKGDKFTKARDVSERQGSDREWMDVSPDGNVYAAWRDGQGYAFNASFDRGVNWTRKVVVGDDMLGGPIVYDRSNETRLFIPAVTFGGALFGGGNPQLVVARSEDRGSNWTILPVMDIPVSPADLIFTTQIFPVLATDTDGTAYLVVSIKQALVPAAVPKPAAPYGVFLFTSKDHGQTWSTPVMVSPLLHAGIFPWIEAGAPGRIVVTWYENTASAPNDLLPDVWNVKLMEGIGYDGSSPQTKIVQMNKDPIHVGSICSSGTACVAGGDRSLLDFFEVTIAPNGQPMVTWVSAHGGTGVGIAAVPPTIFFGTVTGTPLK